MFKIENGVRYQTEYMPPPQELAPVFHVDAHCQVLIDNRARRKACVLETQKARALVQAEVDVKAANIDDQVQVAIRCACGNLPSADAIVAAIRQAATGVERDPRLEAMLRGLDRMLAVWDAEIIADEQKLRGVLKQDHLAALGIAIVEPAPAA